jgi:anaerobic ribonucleoside-triphosphate reductase
MNNCVENIKAHNSTPCKKTVSGTSICPMCMSIMCPVCHRHEVTILSRVTGYVSDVSGWNEGKKQEFKDRQRYKL